jgi:hypothetical protein
MHVATFGFISQLEHVLLVIKIISIQDFRHKGFHPIHQLGFAKAKCCFNYLKMFWERHLTIYLQPLLGYTISKTSMIPWVGNLVFSFWINFFTTLTKTPTKPQNYIKNKTKYIENKNGENIFIVPKSNFCNLCLTEQQIA